MGAQVGGLMDEKKKKQLNEAIAVIRNLCINYDYCILCPFGPHCVFGCNYPCNWKDIE